MRAVVVAAAGLVFAASALIAGAGCTFLVSFDDIAQEDSGLSATDGPTKPDVGSSGDTGSSGGEDVFVPPTDSGADGTADYSKVCTGKADGKYCNGDGVGIDGGDEDDLITCLNGKTANVKTCPFRCQRMVSGYPDECNECNGRADGQYCGDDFPGWHPKNANTKIRCGNGSIVGNIICATMCANTGPNAICQ